MSLPFPPLTEDDEEEAFSAAAGIISGIRDSGMPGLIAVRGAFLALLITYRGPRSAEEDLEMLKEFQHWLFAASQQTES